MLGKLAMGDVKFTPRETSRLLDRLDEGARKVAEVREEIIHAMARRTTKDPADPPPRRAARKKR